MPEADLIVVGGGMAGLTAGARAAAAGARVILVERAGELGGSALLSGGYLWTVPTVEALLSEDPGADPELGAVLVDGFPRAVEWVRSVGVDVSGPSTVLGHGVGYKIDIAAYLRRCANLIRTRDGHVVAHAVTDRLLTRDGAVTGIAVNDRDGYSEVTAGWTLLSTGGFQGDDALRQRLLGPTTPGLPLRANPVSRGDGIRLALGVGAVLAPAPRGFYGHLVAAPLDEFTPREFLRLAFISSDLCVLLNEQGRRFTDERRGDHHNAQAVVGQPGRHALLVLDERLRQVMSTSPHARHVERIDRVAEAMAVGAHVATAASARELGTQAAPWGFDAAGVEAAVARTSLSAPYYGVEVTPSITFGFGGIEIDGTAAVLNDRGKPIPGLLAAGADAAGVYLHGYAGGLSLAATFALAATETMGVG